MSHVRYSVFASAFLALVIGLAGAGNSVSGQRQEPRDRTAVRDERGEVDKLLDELKLTGETVRTACLYECGGNQSAQDVSGGGFIIRVLPEYPATARVARVSGHVAVLVVIDEHGKVVAAQVVSGHPLLRASAVNAAKVSSFSPYLVDGNEVKVKGLITYTFHMDSRL